LVSAFEIGLLNVWILMLYLPLHPLLMTLIDKLVGTGDISKKMGAVPYNEAEKRTAYASMSVHGLLLIYSVFLPLKLGTAWFHIGLPIYLLGLTMLIITTANIATTLLGEPWTEGLYHYSRHPMVLSEFLISIGVSTASASWIFLFLSIVYTVLESSVAVSEERWCLEKYGDAYREYMDRTPRWIGILKSGEK